MFKINVLIRADNYWRLVTGEVIQRESCPTVIKTHLGWVLLKVNPPNAHSQIWDLETLGIKSQEESLYGNLTQTISFKDGRYEVKLPWRERHPPLPSNYQLSLKRLTGLCSCLKRDPPLQQDYDSVIRNQIDNGIVEAVDGVEESENGNSHYIPHYAVITKEGEMIKLRVVYDASAISNSPSLNDCLYAAFLQSNYITNPPQIQSSQHCSDWRYREGFLDDISKPKG